MDKKTMCCKASDNEYLHKDFHGALSNGIEYLHTFYGEEAVKEYLQRFTRAYHSSLMKDLGKRGLIAIKEYFARIYEKENANVAIDYSEDELIIRVYECPAVKHLQQINMPIARLFHESTKTVNETLCEDTEYVAELICNNDNCSCIQRFYKPARRG
jgi:hypothetical protein